MVASKASRLEVFEMAPTSSDSWAVSIPAENVQALAAATDEVPERYLRPLLDVSAAIEEGDEKVPIIDVSRLLHPNYSGEERAKLHSACKDWGFFQVVNHGMPNEMMDRIKVDFEEFFKLPLEEKEAFAPLPNGVQGYGQKIEFFEKKIEWQDVMFLQTLPLHARDVRFWPTSPPTFRTSLDCYSKELHRIACILFEEIGKNLDVEPEKFSAIFSHQSMRVNYYPPCPKAEKVLGINAHSDAASLTLLLQAREVPGLQIKKNKKWLAVEPLPYALTVNVGDSLEILTNGNYKSIEHRAIVDSKKETFSIAAFHGTSVESKIGPLPEILNREDPRYKTVTYAEYLKFLFSAKVEGKNHMDQMKLNN